MRHQQINLTRRAESVRAPASNSLATTLVSAVYGSAQSSNSFRIPDVVPPGFGVTARLPKAALRQITRP